MQLSCHRNHVIHYSCLKQFISTNPRNMNYCPICRAPINCEHFSHMEADILSEEDEESRKSVHVP